MRLGLIGTGLMGAPLSRKIIEAKFPLNVFNRTRSKTNDLESIGAKIYLEIPKLVKDSDTIILMLSDSDAICEVLFNSNVGQYEGKTIIQMSTIAPSESREIQKRIINLRGNYLEAPVLGSIPQIINAELIVLVGGTKDQYNKFHNIFSLFSNNILHIGRIGEASAMKLALNQLIISQTTAFSMSLGYLRENNLDIQKFMNILKGSALYTPAYDKKLPNMLERNFAKPNFPLKHLLKDLDLILGDFGENKINTSSLKGIRKILVDTVQQGFGEHDYSALYNGIHPIKVES